MTKNQLEYWKLRWQQHYQHVMLEQEQQKIEETKRSNVTKEKETERHNRAEEKIAKQQIAIKRVELNQNWVKLTEQMRANYVHDLVTVSSHLQELDTYMAKNKVMEAELFLSIAEASDKSSIEYAKAAVDAFYKAGGVEASIGDTGDGKVGSAKDGQKGASVPKNIASFLGISANAKVTGALAVAVQLFNDAERSGLAASRIRENITRMYPEYVELFGPDAKSKISSDAHKYVGEFGPLAKGGNDVQNSTISSRWDKSSTEYLDKARKYVDSSYDKFKVDDVAHSSITKPNSSGVIISNNSTGRTTNNYGPGVSQSGQSSTPSGTRVIGPSNSSSGPGKSNSGSSKSSGGSRVIYSPGVRSVGPGL